MHQVGILALQGDYALHGTALDRFSDISWHFVRQPNELDKLSGLIIPGGESTSLLKLMAPFNWQSALHDFHKQGKFLFGTCAGMIILANSIIPQQESLALIDITVERNGYGRQIDSFVGIGNIQDNNLGAGNLKMVFIRAPKVTYVGKNVAILATYQDAPTLLQQDNVIVASFHPEMDNDICIYQYFLEQIQLING